MTEQKKTLGKKKSNEKTYSPVGEKKTKVVQKKLPARIIPNMSYGSWWTIAQKRHSFSSDMKNVIYMHFRARGFLVSKRFDDGLKDFGIES